MGRSAIVALSRPAEHLIAVGLLAAEMRRALVAGPHALVAPLTGAIYEALVGEAESKDTASLFLGVARGADGLSFLVGYATLDESVDIDLSKPQIGGALARRIGHVFDAIRLAMTGDGLGAAAAREVLAWALWAALAADDEAQSDLRDALASWRGPTSAMIEALLLLPSAIMGNKERTAKLGRMRVSTRPLSVEQLNLLMLAR